MDPRCRIELFGWLRVYQNGRVITRFQTRQTAGVLAYLAFYSHRSHPRDMLMSVGWPDDAGYTDRHKLRVALNSLRRQLEPPGVPAGTVILADRDTVQLNPKAVTTDVGEFEAALDAAARARDGAEREQHLATAVALYRGELLPGCLEDWVVPEQQRLAEAYFRALDRLIQCMKERGDLAGAIVVARLAVSRDPLREEWHHELIRLLIASGQTGAAQRQSEELERLLGQEVRDAPAAATRELVSQAVRPGPGVCSGAAKAPARNERARRVDGAGQETSAGERPSPNLNAHTTERPFAVSSAAPVATVRLPLRLTRFFGREVEMEGLRELLVGDECRLVTLTGPGGCGKTRLGLELAARLHEPFGGAVWFVSLEDLSDPRLILGKIEGALGIAPTRDIEPLDRVVKFLRGHSPLLLLDNYEHLTPHGVPLLTALLHQVESLTLLVTSRHRLGLAGEREFPVGLLPVPGTEPLGVGRQGLGNEEHARRPLTPASLVVFPSVQLFVDRAQAVRPDFQVTETNMEAVAAVCARLEGLPLALELAAARVQVMTPAQMLSRLQQRFELLMSPKRAGEPRHQSLRAALDWSYHLLSRPLQQFFARLSVFRGGWTAEAAEAVCQEPAALDYLAQLRGYSLVFLEEGQAEMRFRLLETLREYGTEQLREGERAALSRRHAEFFMALAEKMEPELEGPARGNAIEQLLAERDNLRAALDWCVGYAGEEAPGISDEESPAAPGLSPHPCEIGLRLAAALRVLWTARGDLIEGREYLSKLLASSQAATSTARARALDVTAYLANLQSDYFAARDLLAEALAIYREQGLPGPVAATLNMMGWVARDQGDPTAARAYFEAALAHYRRLGNPSDLAQALEALGEIFQSQGNYETARALRHEGLELQRRIANQTGIAQSLWRLAHIARDQADYSTARELLEEGLAIARRTGDAGTVAGFLFRLGRVEKERGDFPHARALLEESRQLFLKDGDRSEVGGPLLELARLDVDEGDLRSARTRIEEHLVDCRKADRKRAVAMGLLHLGSVAQEEGNPSEARRLYEEALLIYRRIGNPVWIAAALLYLGELLRAQRDWEAARALLEESLSLFREISHRPCEAILLRRLAFVDWQREDTDRARALYQESLVMAQCLENQAGVIECLDCLATLEAPAQPERAARLLGATAALRDVSSAIIGAQTLPYGPISLPRLDGYPVAAGEATARAALGKAAFAGAWAEGQAMSLEEAVGYALDRVSPSNLLSRAE